MVSLASQSGWITRTINNPIARIERCFASLALARNWVTILDLFLDPNPSEYLWDPSVYFSFDPLDGSAVN